MNTPFDGPLVEGVTYHQNPGTGDHIFKGMENDVRDQVEEMEMGIDDQPQFHIVTGAPLNSNLKSIWGTDGERCGFLVRPKTGNEWMAVIAAATFEASE